MEVGALGWRSGGDLGFEHGSECTALSERLAFNSIVGMSRTIRWSDKPLFAKGHEIVQRTLRA